MRIAAGPLERGVIRHLLPIPREAVPVASVRALIRPIEHAIQPRETARGVSDRHISREYHENANPALLGAGEIRAAGSGLLLMVGVQRASAAGHIARLSIEPDEASINKVMEYDRGCLHFRPLHQN